MRYLQCKNSSYKKIYNKYSFFVHTVVTEHSLDGFGGDILCIYKTE